MLTLEQISRYVSPQLFQRNPHAALVEYLQYELLDSLFKHKEAASLSFIGGTAIRILYDSLRFSEDLDFDNFGLSFTMFEDLLTKACRDMEYKGFLIEYRIIERGAYHCYIRFPEIFHRSGLGSDAMRKILIQIDSETKEQLYNAQNVLLNKFAVYRQVLAAPAAILLAQKMMTLLLRKREKGRDIFDTSFLLGLSKPDFEYIEKSLEMDKTTFLRHFFDRIEKLDLEFLAKDVEPFLLFPEQKERIMTFREYWKTVEL
ncbi:MAG: nucleotidyl transferase AbiEii/AbiGii toxin family protein [Deltaproteobacteria bacterium]|nr:nucleotidyl transferase AbiEii/AbiGii toxin family protein [Deltaproteobacteria bacterium]